MTKPIAKTAYQAVAFDKSLDTFPKLLLDHAQRRPDKSSVREKDLGIWQSWSWRQVADEVRALSCGLAQLGLKRGDKVAIIGDNRPRLYWSVIAAQCLGAIPVPLYQDAVAEEIAFVLDNADVRFAVVEDQEQVDKIIDTKAQCPQIEYVLYDDPRGMQHYDYPFLKPIDSVQATGNKSHNPTWGFVTFLTNALYSG